MDPSGIPKLRYLHAENTLIRVKLEFFRRLTTDDLKESLAPGGKACLKVRPDGTILDGHHRIRVLADRGVDVDLLPREIMEKCDES
jgi:ParB-like chromosome segregation protein Spo0J